MSTSNFTSHDKQQGFVSSPLNIRWSQWPSLRPTWASSLGKREAILRKGRYVLCWHWESHWVTGSDSTAIALFKMQNVDVFRGRISINHCMQILPVEKSFPCKSLLTALIELTLVTEGMLNADGPLIVLSQEKINKRQQKCLAPSRAQSQRGRQGGRTRVSFCLAIVAHYHRHIKKQNLAALFHNHQHACGERSAQTTCTDLDRRHCWLAICNSLHRGTWIHKREVKKKQLCCC